MANGLPGTTTQNWTGPLHVDLTETQAQDYLSQINGSISLEDLQRILAILPWRGRIPTRGQTYGKPQMESIRQALTAKMAELQRGQVPQAQAPQVPAAFGGMQEVAPAITSPQALAGQEMGQGYAPTLAEQIQQQWEERIGGEPSKAYQAYVEGLRGQHISPYSPMGEYISTQGPEAFSRYLLSQAPKIKAGGGWSSQYYPWLRNLGPMAQGVGNWQDILGIYNQQAPNISQQTFRDYLQNNPQIAYMVGLLASSQYQALPGFIKPYAQSGYNELYNRYLQEAGGQEIVPWLEQQQAFY